MIVNETTILSIINAKLLFFTLQSILFFMLVYVLILAVMYVIFTIFFIKSTKLCEIVVSCLQ